MEPPCFPWLENLESSWGLPDGDITVGGRTITSCFDLGLLCVLPDGEFLTLGLLECIDRNPELTVSHARRWTLVKFLWGVCRQRQRQSTFCHLLLSMLAVCLPFFSLLLSGFALGASLLQLQHSLDVCLLLPRGSLASPGHTRPLVSRHCSIHCGGHELQTTRLTRKDHLRRRRRGAACRGAAAGSGTLPAARPALAGR